MVPPEAFLVGLGVLVSVTANTVGIGVSVSVAVGGSVSVDVYVESGTEWVALGSGGVVGVSDGRVRVYFENSSANRLKVRLLPQIDLA